MRVPPEKSRMRLHCFEPLTASMSGRMMPHGTLACPRQNGFLVRAVVCCHWRIADGGTQAAARAAGPLARRHRCPAEEFHRLSSPGNLAPPERCPDTFVLGLVPV